MSKFFLIKYKNVQPKDVEQQLEKVLTNISSDRVENEYVVKKSNRLDELYIGMLNPNKNIEDTGFFTYGKKLTQKTNLLPDGSYAEITYDSNSIEFYCDRFESKTIWFFYDDEKLIISNSQRALISLKKTFFLNDKAVSWFLSSGTLGFQNAWDVEIKKVLNKKRYVFNVNSFELNIVDADYNTLKIKYKNQKQFDNDFLNLTKNNFPVSNSYNDYILPLSGGNDSRLLFYISKELQHFKNIKLINWGTENKLHFDDKKAALQISEFYKSEMVNEYLPKRINNPDLFFETYIKLTDCRIDHFNAFTDHFQIFENLYKSRYRNIVRGDIPFTEGLDLNANMARAHIGIPLFSDYKNEQEFDLEKWKSIQQSDLPDINKSAQESLIAWRDRLYIDFRIPLVISAFNDMIGCFVENSSPMMTYSHFLLYQQQNDNHKGNKEHIVRLSKKMDKSKVPFNAVPSIPRLSDLFENESIQYLIKALENNAVFSDKLIQQVKESLLKLHHQEGFNQNNKSLIFKIKSILSEYLPITLKSKLKSKIPKYFNGIELAYRIILINELSNIYLNDSKLINKNDF